MELPCRKSNTQGAGAASGARIFDQRDLTIANSTRPNHPKEQELRALALWSEGQVWCSREMHGAVTGVQ